MLDIQKVADAISEVAEQEALPRFRNLKDGDIQEKAAGELVTAADIAVEEALSARLLDLLPGSLVVGEEGVHADPALMDHLDSEETLWIIDPIDGTRNFARGREAFAIMVALVSRRESRAAWILEPASGRFGVAEAGSGAWMAGQRLQAALPDRPQAMSGSLHASSYAPRELGQRVDQRRGRVRAVKSLGCAGAEYLRLAEGTMHFSLFTRLMPWDHVPGTLLHREAGGFSRCFDRQPYRADRYRELGLLMAPDAAGWDALFDSLLAED
ncbi:inositol monophosphatase [Pelagibius sp.]|uniref:inositol monophosphatase family protein n=1 Tax=Pelagibius sp. TaxID=1931238 RepID=UPI00261931FC|nr:inositol monophosphatase [Pelagibius sp.]